MNRLYLIGIQYGFSTNSSSTHYIVNINKDAVTKDKLSKLAIIKKYNGHIADFVSASSYIFHRDFFICASPEMKALYFACHFAPYLQNPDRQAISFTTNGDKIISKTFTIEDVLKYFPEARELSKVYDIKEGIDHQSELAIPTIYGSDQPAIEVFSKLARPIIENDDYIIIGGDDGDSEFYDIVKNSETDDIIDAINILYSNDMVLDIVARKEAWGWVLFDRTFGIKYRLADDPNFNINSVNAYVPELVELKITNRCYKRCKFCYESSTPRGRHAAGYYFNDIYEVFSKLKILEVSIGGGEPFTNPELFDIVSYLSKLDIYSNITTRYYDLIKYPPMLNIFRSLKIGKIGISIDNAKTLSRLLPYLIEINSNFSITTDSRINLHHIVGLNPNTIDDIKQIVSTLDKHLKYSSIALVLLGFKHVGRGAKLEPYPYDKNELINIIENTHVPIALDSTMIRQLKHELKHSNIPPRRYEDTEGTTSKYIDVVNSLVGPNSYEKDLLINYAKYRPQEIDKLISLLLTPYHKWQSK